MSNHIYNWYKYVSTKKTNSNHTICPFAKNATLVYLKVILISSKKKF